MQGIEIIGLLGGACFGFAGVPAAVATLRARKHLGTPLSVCAAIVLGCILMVTYLFLRFSFDWVVAVTYTVEIVSWATLLYYAVKERILQRHK